MVSHVDVAHPITVVVVEHVIAVGPAECKSGPTLVARFTCADIVR